MDCKKKESEKVSRWESEMAHRPLSHFLTFSLSFLFMIFSQFQSIGQSPSTPAQEQKNPNADSLATDTSDLKASLLLELDYGTNRGYQLKRKISGADTSSKYLSPSLTYETKSGFFTSLSFYSTPGDKKKKWDTFLFGLGWDFKWSKKADIDGSIGYTRFVYNETIKKNDVKPTSNDLNIYAKHDFNVVAVKLAGDYFFGGSKGDWDLILDIDHDFYIDEVLWTNDELSIDPMVTMVGSTLNYYLSSITIPDT